MSTTKGLHQYGKLPTVNGKEAKVDTIRTGDKRFDDYVSRFGGFVRGTWMFLTGTAGAGKTTLIVFLQSLCKDVKTVLWSLEMPASSVQRQCGAYDVKHGNAFIADENSCPTFQGFMDLLEREKPDLIAIDSIQMVAKLLSNEMGEDEAIEHVMKVLRTFNEKNNSTLIFIGQMTKGGVFKGPQEILQLADAHMEMTFYQDRNERVISWGGKNRNTDNPAAKMFYTFGEGKLNFFSPDEWEIEKNKFTYLDFMMQASYRYLAAVKGRKGYGEAMKELRVKQSNLEKSGVSDDEFFFQMTKAIHEKLSELQTAAA